MEKKYADEKQPMFDVRGNATIEDLVKIAQQPFEKVKDKHDLRKQNPVFDFELDTEFECFCSNI